MVFAEKLTKTNLVTAHMETIDQADVSRRLIMRGYERKVVPGTMRGEWNEEAGCMVFVFDVIYRDPNGILPAVKRIESLISKYK